MKNKKKLLFIQLNEINFEFIDDYIEKLGLKNLEAIKNDGLIETSSEKKYEHLEPWIQWASVTTGKTLNEHKIFRLGDIVNYGDDQIYELIEQMNFKVGAICPMNVENRLKNPLYFIPDPWTNTEPDKSFWSKNISITLSQAINDNAKNKISLKSIFFLCLSFIKFARYKNYLKFIFYFLTSFNKKWRKAIFLDLFLHEVHLSNINKFNPNFSTIFFNSFAHIQHHYLYNSQPINGKYKNPEWYIEDRYDPIAEALIVYDEIIGDYLKKIDCNLIIATGLRQVPFEKIKFDYRLKNHAKFLNDLKINFLRVEPRMTGDFLISFESDSDSINAYKILSKLRTNDNELVFNKIENRGKSIFLTLTYDKEVSNNIYIVNENQKINFEKYTDFVGIKNGKHDEKGYSYFRGDIKKFSIKQNDHVKNIFHSINNYFVS